MSHIVPRAPPSRLTCGRLHWHPGCLLGRQLLVRDGQIGGLEDAGGDGVLDDLPVGGGGLLGEVALAPQGRWWRRGPVGGSRGSPLLGRNDGEKPRLLGGRFLPCGLQPLEVAPALAGAVRPLALARGCRLSGGAGGAAGAGRPAWPPGGMPGGELGALALRRCRGLTPNGPPRPGVSGDESLVSGGTGGACCMPCSGTGAACSVLSPPWLAAGEVGCGTAGWAAGGRSTPPVPPRIDWWAQALEAQPDG